MDKSLGASIERQIAYMRMCINNAERYMAQKRYAAAYKEFKQLKSCSFCAQQWLSAESYSAARDWGHIVTRSVRKRK